MSLMQRVWTGLVIVVVVFLAARVSITLLSPHPVYVDDPAPCASVSENCARLSIDDAHRMDESPSSSRQVQRTPSGARWTIGRTTPHG